ncbi:molybdopterin oxidoreductase family protein [Sulfuricurvum sp.]|uniref:molybdopterin oxidoreductase family protein n=1 Tax=Sulfuricurvum sp. TaxID=2025608 RepID=UPI003C47CA82
MSDVIATGCPFCGTGCGLNVECTDKGYKVKGDKTNPSTHGDLCFKPIQMAKALDANRLTTPLYRSCKTDPFREISWEEAICVLADKIKSLPPEALYFYLSGQLLTEESYLFTKLIKGYLGTNNVDANSRLCMASAVVAHKMAFGSDGAIGNYADIDDADVILITGSNPAWAHPILHRRIMARKKSHPETQIIVIDPIRTETAEKADLWLGLRSGSDTMLYNALLAKIHTLGGCDSDFISRSCDGFAKAIDAAQAIPYPEAVQSCGLSIKDTDMLVDLFVSDKKIVGLWCQGLNQAVDGVMRNLGFINLFLATGRVNAQKGLPFSLTGQPNAMGGREVGYLSNGLPGYRDVRNPQDREVCEHHWNLSSDTISSEVGMTITDAIEAIIRDELRFLWVACTNPLLTLPDISKTRSALLQNDLFLVVQDCVLSETAALANLVLPSTAWGEKEGNMTNSERFIKRVRSFKPAPHGAKSDSEIVCSVAKALGFSGFDFTDTAEIYDEYKKLTEKRSCDQSTQEYETLSYQWGGERLYSDELFSTRSRRAQFHPILSSAPQSNEDEFVLITGRTKKQWHTMTRTGNVPELLKDEEEPYLLINEVEAQKLGIKEGEPVILSNHLGSLELPIRFGTLAPNHLFAPFGYPKVPINTLIPVFNDPFSFQSALKSARVKITSQND